ncbi:ABC transporter ATP-binding protein [Lacticigenium naphthae]|uniref:ABC transporter ATP-binding protein n=1 Tax=Lacticigenium naphthae TaxID=515351 RepID=UPI00041552BA|nr:ABC transporter ATP-binding protein [Lacticigenium naphthae]
MLTVFKDLKPFFKENKKRYTLAILGMLSDNLLILVPPYILGLVIDAIYQQTLTIEQLIRYSIVFFVVVSLSYVIGAMWIFQLFGGSNLLTRDLRRQLMNHFSKMRAIFYEKFRTGDLMARATNDLRAVSEMAGFGVMVFMDSTLFLGSIILVMFFTVSWKLTLVSLLPLPLLGWILKILGDKVNKRFKASQDAFADINDEVLEAVEGVRVIRAYVQEQSKQEQFEERTEDVLAKNIAVTKINSTFQPIITILLGVSYFIAFGYGAMLVSSNALSIGELISFQVYLGMVVWPVQSIGELINLVEQGSASLERVNEVLDASDDMEEYGTQKITSQPSVQFDNVSFKYPQSPDYNLKNVSLTVPAGMTVGIVGKTGSGKTTLIKQLLRLYPLGEGKILLEGKNIKEYSLDEIHSKIGYVPQEYILFSRSVRDNISFGVEEASEESILNAIKMANLEDDIKRMPEGLDTLVGEKGVALSGGQKQRISLARALLLNPDILLLDDTLSAVDAKTEKNIINTIQTVRREKTTFIITHRLSAIHHADWIIVLEDGKIIDEGTHASLIEDENSWYYAQFERQKLKEESI